MALTLKVRAIPGLLCPHASPKLGFVGWERALGADEEVDYVIPGGSSYRLLDSQDVPDSTYYRRALRRGDILEG